MANRHALLIGNAEYEDKALRKLKAPDADVRALAELLRAPDIGDFAVQTLSNEPSHKVQRAIGEFLARRGPDDLVLLYLSGHGVLDPQGRLWLAFKDTEKDLLTATGIGAAWLKDQMDNSRARRQVLLLDCCYSGAFSAGEKGAEALGRPAILDDTFGEKERGRVVLTATDLLQDCSFLRPLSFLAQRNQEHHALSLGVWRKEVGHGVIKKGQARGPKP